MLCSSPYSSAIGNFLIGDSSISLPLDVPTPPTGLVILSYLYAQYTDDDDLLAFVEAYNTIEQDYSNWFQALMLPIYTLQSGALLDWVGAGIYGVIRPTLGPSDNEAIGPLNTYELNTTELNQYYFVNPAVFQLVDDDTYKRVITWNFYKGDGPQFAVSWLKRRILRFLTGLCGTDITDVSQLDAISVTWGPSGQINIRLITSLVQITGGAILDVMGLNTDLLNGTSISLTPFANQFAMATLFKEAMDQMVLEMPFEYSVNVQIDASSTALFVQYDRHGNLVPV